MRGSPSRVAAERWRTAPNGPPSLSRPSQPSDSRQRIRLCRRVQREPPRGVELQGPRFLPIVHGPAHVRDGGEPRRARLAGAGRAAPVGADLPVPVARQACVGRRAAPSTDAHLRRERRGLLRGPRNTRARSRPVQDGRGHRRAEVELGHAAEPAPARGLPRRRLPRARRRARLRAATQTATRVLRKGGLQARPGEPTPRHWELRCHTDPPQFNRSGSSLQSWRPPKGSHWEQYDFPSRQESRKP